MQWPSGACSGPLVHAAFSPRRQVSPTTALPSKDGSVVYVLSMDGVMVEDTSAEPNKWTGNVHMAGLRAWVKSPGAKLQTKCINPMVIHVSQRGSCRSHRGGMEEP